MIRNIRHIQIKKIAFDQKSNKSGDPSSSQHTTGKERFPVTDLLADAQLRRSAQSGDGPVTNPTTGSRFHICYATWRGIPTG